jgi:hypothetical protein
VKLPADPKERKKVLALVAIGVIGALYGLLTGVAKPFLAGKAAMEERMASLKHDIARAVQTVSHMDAMQEKNYSISTQILHIASSYVLRPRLGNYLLGAKEQIERHAEGWNVTIKGVSEIGILELPKPKEVVDPHASAGEPDTKQKDRENGSGYTFKSYAVRVDMLCGFHALTGLLRGLEVSNPYLCISDIGVTADANSPCEHKINFVVHWPIWADAQTEARLREQTETARNELDKESRNPA